MNGSRGAKGSVNDRIISFLYKKRYLEYLKKKESYTLEERKKAVQRLEKLKEFKEESDISLLESDDRKLVIEVLSKSNKIKNNNDTNSLKNVEKKSSRIEQSNEISETALDELIALSDQINNYEELSINEENFEELIDNSEIGKIELDDMIDIEEEVEKKTEEEVIIEEVTNFVNESLELLYDIKYEIKYLEASIEEQYTEEDINKLNERYKELNKKLEELKEKYIVIKNKYDFDGYEVLDSILLVESIEDYKSKASLEELENLVDACKTEVEEIDGVVIEEEKKNRVGIDLQERKNKIVKRDQDFIITEGKVVHLESIDKIVYDESIKQQKIIAEIEDKISHIETQLVTTRQYIFHTGRLFASFLRVATGILTTPLTHNFLGLNLGTNLINQGIRGIRTNLVPEEVQNTEVKYKYENMEREILKTSSDVNDTLLLINDSLDQIDLLKDEFKQKFEPYSLYIPEYNSVKNMLNDVEKKMKIKKEQIETMQKKLDEQYKNNKQKVLKLNH